MKNNIELLNLYKEEKALIIGSVETRTGLEEFPSFQEWKAEYIQDYMATHKEVSVEEADALMDAAVKEAEEILDASSEQELVGKKNKQVDPNKEVSDTNQVEQTNIQTHKTEKVKKMTTATATKAPKASKVAKPKKVAATEPSKADLARKVFAKMYPQVVAGKKARKDVIEKLKSEGNMSDAYASTAYQKMLKEAKATA